VNSTGSTCIAGLPQYLPTDQPGASSGGKVEGVCEVWRVNLILL